MENLNKEIDLIINQAQSRGLNCQMTKSNRWMIKCKNHYIFYQSDQGWILSIPEKIIISLPNFMVFDFLEQIE